MPKPVPAVHIMLNLPRADILYGCVHSRDVSEADLSFSLIEQYPVRLVEQYDSHLTLSTSGPGACRAVILTTTSVSKTLEACTMTHSTYQYNAMQYTQQVIVWCAPYDDIYTVFRKKVIYLFFFSYISRSFFFTYFMKISNNGVNVLQPVFLHEADIYSACFKAEL